MKLQQMREYRMIKFRVISKISDVRESTLQAEEGIISKDSIYEIGLMEVRDYGTLGELLPLNKFKVQVSPEAFACYEVGVEYELTLSMPQFEQSHQPIRCECLDPVDARGTTGGCPAEIHHRFIFGKGLTCTSEDIKSKRFSSPVYQY